MSGFDFDDLELRENLGEVKDLKNFVQESKESDVEVDTAPSIETYGSYTKIQTPPLQVTHPGSGMKYPFRFDKTDNVDNDSEFEEEVDVQYQDYQTGINETDFQTKIVKPNRNYMACSAPIGIPSRWTVQKAAEQPTNENDIPFASTFVPPHVLAQMEDEKRQDGFEVGLSPTQNWKQDKLRMRNKILTLTGFAGPEESQASSYLRHIGRPPKLVGGLKAQLHNASQLEENGKQAQ